MIYLDNAATTAVAPEVLAAMMPYFTQDYGNPGSIHTMGSKTREAVEYARKQVADSIGAKPYQIIFTSGGTEANNMVIHGVQMKDRFDLERPIALTSAVEHPAILNAMKEEFLTIKVPVDDTGIVDIKDVYKKISLPSRPIDFVSIMMANNELGTFNNIAEIGVLCREYNIPFHTDAVQAFGSVPIDVNAMNLDFLSASAHKFHGPKGVGFLFARHPEKLKPLVFGGGQESGRRSGTENVPGIIGLGKAAELAAEGVGSHNKWMEYAQSILVKGLQEHLGNTFWINGSPQPYSKTVSLRFDCVDGESLVLMLSSAGIMVSAGSACASHEANPSHVLKAIGLSDLEARSSIRISMSKYTTEQEIMDAVHAISTCVKTLRMEL